MRLRARGMQARKAPVPRRYRRVLCLIYVKFLARFGRISQALEILTRGGGGYGSRIGHRQRITGQFICRDTHIERVADGNPGGTVASARGISRSLFSRRRRTEVVLTAGTVAGSRDRGGLVRSARGLSTTSDCRRRHTSGGVVRQHCGRVRQARQSCLSPSDAPRASGGCLTRRDCEDWRL
jgi:hypothetical protein